MANDFTPRRISWEESQADASLIRGLVNVLISDKEATDILVKRIQDACELNPRFIYEPTDETRAMFYARVLVSECQRMLSAA